MGPGTSAVAEGRSGAPGSDFGLFGIWDDDLRGDIDRALCARNASSLMPVRVATALLRDSTETGSRAFFAACPIGRQAAARLEGGEPGEGRRPLPARDPGSVHLAVDDGSDPHAVADAERDQRAALAGALQLVQRGGKEDGAGG